MWKKYVTRRIAVQIAQAWSIAWGDAMHRMYGTSLRSTLVFSKEGTVDYYVDARQHDRYTKDLFARVRRERFLKTFHHDAQHDLERIFQHVRGILARDLSRLSNRELASLYTRHIIPETIQFYIRMWTVFNIGDTVLPTIFLKELAKCTPDPKKQNEYLLLFSSPVQPNDVTHERIDLLKIARVRHRLTSEELRHRLERHARAYRHIPMFGFDHEPYTIAHFAKCLRAIRNPDGELTEIQRQFRSRKRAVRAAQKSLRPGKHLRLLIDFLGESVFLRDHRDMIRQKLNLELCRFYVEAGARLHLDVRQVAYATNKEIIEYLKSGRRFPMREIRRRERAWLHIKKGARAVLYSGREALRKACIELQEDTTVRVTEVRGIVGSSGTARGTARIVMTNRALNKVRKGDILITPMTRQDFVPALRKCAALVTDEGSVAAHAAIIARELGIPCIVAAKIATRVFKDGDPIHVDAHRGIARLA